MVNGRAGRGPLAGARTRRGGRLTDKSQTARGTKAEEGEDNQEGPAPPNDPLTPPVGARKNRVAPTDLGHGVQRRVSDPLSVGRSSTSPLRHPANCRTTQTQQPQ
jgi:hypothetical protein